MHDIEIWCIDVDEDRYSRADNAVAKHESITYLGGDGWRLPVSEVIALIEGKVNNYYVPLAKHSYVRVVNGPNGKYVRAVLTDFGNEMHCDNLFAMGRCGKEVTDDMHDDLQNLEVGRQDLEKEDKSESLGPPDLITIAHDDYHAKYIGKTENDLQFFVTSLFVPGGNEFLATFVFNMNGDLVESKVDLLGTRETMDLEKSRSLREFRLNELGNTTFQTIEVKPFTVEHHGVMMGLIPSKFDDYWTVELLPGNFMAFYEPWDSGFYDT